jgi:hypothetical protein
VEMLRQGRLKLDQFLREVQNGFGRAGQGIVSLYQQFDQGGKPYLVMGPQDGQMVQQVLHFPLDMLRSGVNVRVAATSAQLNKEAQIRTNQIVLQMVMQFYTQMMQALQIAFSPDPMIPQPMRMMAMQWIQGGTVLTRRILDEYDIQDLDRIIPDLGGQQSYAPPTQTFGSPAQFGGAPVSQGPPQPQGLSNYGPAGFGANGPGFGGPPQFRLPPGNQPYAG